MVAVAAWRREDLGEAIQELEGGEAERGAAGGIGPREEVEDLVGAAADEVGRRLGHALGVTGRAGTSALAGERDPVALHLSCTGYNVGFD